MNTNRIEKKILLRAPLARVWRALSDSREFGAWFGFTFEGPFVPGAALRGPARFDAPADRPAALRPRPAVDRPASRRLQRHATGRDEAPTCDGGRGARAQRAPRARERVAARAEASRRGAALPWL